MSTAEKPDRGRTHERRWYHITPDRFIIALLVVECLLWLSEHFGAGWHMGHAVLATLAVVGMTVILMGLWISAAILFRQRFQLSIRSLLVMVAIAAQFLNSQLCVGRDSGAPAKPPIDSAVKRDEWERLWRSLLPKAGHADNGFVAEAVISSEATTVRQPLSLVIAVRNCNEQSANLDVRYYFRSVTVIVWIRDASGKFVGLTDAGKRFWSSSYSGSDGWYTMLVRPGSGYGMFVPLEEFFDLSRPGKYTLLALPLITDYRVFPISPVAKPIAFEIRPRAIQSSERPHVRTTADSPRFNTADAFDKRWRSAEALSERGRCGLVLSSLISPPLAPQTVGLAVSLTNLDVPIDAEREFRLFFDGIDVTYAAKALPGAQVGSQALEYRILLRDETGAEVRMTDSGKAWLATRKVTRRGKLGPGESVGFVFPLDRMFELKPRCEYTAMALLLDNERADSGWASRPVKFRLPEEEISGKDRPPYGSSPMWEQLAATAGATKHGYVLSSQMTFNAGRYLLNVKLTHEPLGAAGPRLFPIGDIVLVRDSRGLPVIPFDRGKIGGHLNWEHHAQPEATRRGEMSDRGEYDLHDRYPLRPGSRYSLIVATNLTPNEKEAWEKRDPAAIGRIVCEPLTFTVPDAYADDRNPPVEDALSTHDLTASQHVGTLTAEQKWQERSRFAGKAFGGLELSALSVTPADGKHANLKVSVYNRSEQRTLTIKKWLGESDYEIIMRYSDGSEVPMTTEGKKFFGIRSLLDSIVLEPGKSFSVVLPIDRLFEMDRPGDYTVLASLPVAGDVDAVLTAAPVKVRVDAKPSQQK